MQKDCTARKEVCIIKAKQKKFFKMEEQNILLKLQDNQDGCKCATYLHTLRNWKRKPFLITP